MSVVGPDVEERSGQVVTRRWTGSRPHGVGLPRLGALLAVLFGIVGMHALSHPGPGHDAAPSTVGAAYADVRAVAAHDRAAAAGHGAGHVTEAALDDDGGPGHSPGDVMMLCAAMLVVAGALLGLLARLRRVPRLWAVLRPALTYFRPTARAARGGTGPPPAWQFSVIRC